MTVLCQTRKPLQAVRHGESVLVTGASGYTGAYLCHGLLEAGFDVHALVRKNSDTTLLRAATHGRARLQVFDDNLPDLMNSMKPVIVYHVAAKVTNSHEYGEIDSILDSNVVFGTKILESMLQVGCRKLVNVSTSWVHFQQEQYNPVNLYAASKKAFLDIVEYYHKAYHVDYVNLELYDSFGRCDRRPKLLNLIKKIARTGERLATTEGRQDIALVYIDDLVDALITAGNIVSQHDGITDTYVVLPPKVVTLRELVSMIESIVGCKLAIGWGEKPYRPREVMKPWNRGEKLPGWSPKISLEEGLRRFFLTDD